MKNLLIISSGGDAPGMNAAIRAAVRTAIAKGLCVYGAEMGYHGLIHQQLVELNEQSVSNCIQRGGTILKTARAKAFHQKSVRDQCRAFIASKQIDGIVVLGGNGSFQGAALLHQEGGPNVIGIPCTIDNDIVGTDYTIGFDTARNTALQAIDKIRDTASSLDRHFIIEVMGRASGFLAVDVGLAGGAETILIPEFSSSIDALVKKIQHRKREKLSSIIVAAEADQPGHTIQLAEQIKQKTGDEYKVCILGHTQRGGDPSALDRKLATIMGARAVDALMHNQTNQMFALQEGNITMVDFPDPNNATRYFTDKALLQLNDVICET